MSNDLYTNFNFATANFQNNIGLNVKDVMREAGLEPEYAVWLVGCDCAHQWRYTPNATSRDW